MAKVSVIIPSRSERFLAPTVADILAKARGAVEVIAVLDGYWPDPPLAEHASLVQLHRGQPMGMRAAINAAAQVATGDFLMKCDAHCMFADGFDLELASNTDGDWVVIPRRFSLDPENWAILDTGKSPVDYHYLSCPIWSIRNRDDYSMHGMEWRDRGRERRSKPEFDLDETMSFQGSCWFMSRNHWNRIGPMTEVGYGSFCQEPQEIGNKTWLGGGRVMVNKRTWYAHLHKGKTYGRGYFQSAREIYEGHVYSAKYWMNDCWAGRIHDMAWLVDRFSPVPGWPANWQEQQRTTMVQEGYGPP